MNEFTDRCYKCHSLNHENRWLDEAGTLRCGACHGIIKWNFERPKCDRECKSCSGKCLFRICHELSGEPLSKEEKEKLKFLLSKKITDPYIHN